MIRSCKIDTNSQIYTTASQRCRDVRVVCRLQTIYTNSHSLLIGCRFYKTPMRTSHFNSLRFLVAHTVYARIMGNHRLRHTTSECKLCAHVQGSLHFTAVHCDKEVSTGYRLGLADDAQAIDNSSSRFCVHWNT